MNLRRTLLPPVDIMSVTSELPKEPVLVEKCTLEAALSNDSLWDVCDYRLRDSECDEDDMMWMACSSKY